MIGRQARSHRLPPSQSVACLSGPVLSEPTPSAAGDGPSGGPCVLLMAGLGPYMMLLSGCHVLPVAGQQNEHHRGQKMRPHQCARQSKLWQGRRWPRSQPSRCQRHQSIACMSEEQNPSGRPTAVLSGRPYAGGRGRPIQVAHCGCSLQRRTQDRCWEGQQVLPLFPSCICMSIQARQETRDLVGRGEKWWGYWG